jgi:subtilisin family serine protease
MLGPKSFQVFSAVVLTASFSSYCFAQEKPRLDFKPGEVIVGYDTESDRQASESKLKRASIINSFGLLGGQRAQKVEIQPFKDTALLLKVSLPAGQNAFASDDRELQRRLIDDLAEQIKKVDPKVRYVYPNYLMQIPEKKPSPVNEGQLKKRLASLLKTSAMPSNGFPDDPQFASGLQWNYQALPRGMNAVAAWRVTTGDRKVVVAVLDSGILRSHPDVAGSGNLLPGYNFVSDGSGRSNDPMDRQTIFHGSHVASIIGAVATNNKLHMAGVNWAVSVLPVRVANEAGGASNKDVADAILWAAGLPVEGVPINEAPADVINLSLGQEVPCSQSSLIGDAVEKARAAGAVLVVAAGNSSKDIVGFSPAGCLGVISVAAANVNGRLATYSNHGNVSIVAPGGESDIPVVGISEGGTAGYAGTSFAAPHVSAAIALALSTHDEWKRKPDLIAAAIRETAVSMPPSACSRSCGPGQLDAARLLDYQPPSVKPPAVAKSPSTAPAVAATPATMKTASAADFSGSWLTGQGTVLVISGEDWLHPTKGQATISPAGQNQLIVRYPQQTGVTCMYRAMVIEDGGALRLDPTNASQSEEFCPSGRLTSTAGVAAVQSKPATKVASETSKPSMSGRWLIAEAGEILVIHEGRWLHPTKGAADFTSLADDRLTVQYPQPASAKCAYRVAVLEGGKALELIPVNALQPDDYCPSGRLTSVP